MPSRTDISRRPRRVLFAAACLLGLIYACSRSTTHTGTESPLVLSAQAPKASNSEPETLASTRPSSGTGPGLPATVNFINATYNVTVTALGLSLCSGTANVLVNGSFSAGNTAQLLQVPNATLNCKALGIINLAQILSSVATPPPAGVNPLVVSDNMIAFSTIGATTYNPPLPVLPAFFSSSAAALANLDITVPDIEVATATGSGSGTVTMTMNSYDQSYTLSALNLTLPHVMDFTVTDTGFAGIAKLSSSIFDSMEFKLSSVPLAIAALTLKAKLTDLAVAASGPNDASGPIGGVSTSIEKDPSSPLAGLGNQVEVTLQLDLASQEGLSAELAAATSDSAASIGESIGGQPSGG